MDQRSVVQSFLHKKSKTGLLNQKKYFHLDDDLGVVHYGKSYDALDSGHNKNKKVHLATVDAVRIKDPQGPWFDLVTPARTYALKAKDEAHRRQWVDAISTHPDFFGTVDHRKKRHSDATRLELKKTRLTQLKEEEEAKSKEQFASKIELPKPLEEMTEEDRAYWTEKIRLNELKQNAGAIMAKSLAQKSKKGVFTTSKNSPVGFANGGARGKKMAAKSRLKNNASSSASASGKKNESTKERIKRLAEASGSVTGGGLAGIGKEMANSRLNADLQTKRKQHEAKESERKERERLLRKKEEAQRLRDKPKGLAEVISK